MRRGQLAVVTLFTTALLVLGIVLVGSAASKWFLAMEGTDPLVNILLEWSWVFIFLVAGVSFFVWFAVVRGQ